MIQWASVIAQLERRMRHIEIAAAVNRSEGWVGLLKRGKIRDPGYVPGTLLVALCAQHGIVVPRETQDTQVRAADTV